MATLAPKSQASSASLLHRVTTFQSTYDQSLSSFAPEVLKHILANTQQSAIKPPFVQTFEAVGLFADVSGFTKATEALSNAMGDLGTEILAHKINSYLPHIAKKIVGSGGDVVKFAGDALICIWPPPPESIFNEYEIEFKKLEKKWRRYQHLNDAERSRSGKYEKLVKKFESQKKLYMLRKFEIDKVQKEAVKKNIFAAIQCAIEIQDQFGSMDLSGSYYSHKSYKSSSRKSTRTRVTQMMSSKKDKKDKKAVKFRVKLGIGLGKIHLLIVGGALGRCEYLICGDGLIQAFDCENDCDVEENITIVVSEEIVNKVDGIEESFVVKRLEPSKNYQVVKMNKRRRRIERKQYGHLIPDISNGLANKLASYVPAAVKPHLEMPQQIWTGELREVTIVFVSLPWNARSFLKFTDAILDDLQTIIYRLQVVIYKYQGSLNKFVIDDKGSTVMCVFGLPPVAHESDACRAVLAALELRECIGRKEQPAAIGVSSGTVFVGIIGSKGVRREYGILGDKVNLSARLMALSRKNPVKLGEVIVDDSVYLRARNEIRIEWSDLQCIWVKGKMDKVHIWRPARNNIAISAHKIGQASYLETSDKISIRQIESELLKFKKSGKKEGRVILIQGEVGIGKSSLLGQIQVRNSSFFWVLWGKANEFNDIEMNSTDFGSKCIVWKQILLGFTQRYSLCTARNRYLFSLYLRERRSDLYKFLFLLSDLIDLGADNTLLISTVYANNDALRGSTPANLLNKYRSDIIFCLLEWSARIKPIAIIIDEIQYLTRTDWQITRRLCALVERKIVHNVCVFLGSTPIDNQRYCPLFSGSALINKYREIRCKYTHRVITPSPWGLNKTSFFIRKYFDIAHVSARLVASVHSQCGGRPGFCERFLSQLESAGTKYIIIYHRDTGAMVSSHHLQHHHSDRASMTAAFHTDIDAMFRIGLDVEFPVPAYIMSITLSHCDKLSTEQAFILKIAAVICKSKGNNSTQFEEHMIRGCHPLPETKLNARRRIRNALNRLCEMQFIYVSNKERKRKMTLHDDISSIINIDRDAKQQQQQQQGGAPANSVASYNNFDQFIDQLDLNNNDLNNEDDHVDLTDFDGITDPMPATKALLQEPSKSVPYKRGKMFKRGVNFINMTETQRTFVFKHRTLYWIKDDNEEYPRSRVKFDETVKKLKREDQRSCSIKTPRKEYILRCQKKKDMDQWFNLFTQALRQNWLPHSMVKRMVAPPPKKIKTVGLKLNGVQFAAAPNKKKGVSFSPQPDVEYSNHSESIEKIIENYNYETDDEEDSDDDSSGEPINMEDIVNVLKLQASEHNINGNELSLSEHEIDLNQDDDEKEEDEANENIIGPQAGDRTYEFAYGFLRDIVYKQMLYNQRKQLHTNALKYIAKCLEEKNSVDDKLALLHTRHIECVQRYSDMLQGDDHQKIAFMPNKRQSFFAKRAR